MSEEVDNSNLFGQKSPRVRVICPECQTMTKKDTDTEAQQVADKHNERMHGGEDVAGVHAEDVQSPKEMIGELREKMDTEDFLAFMANLDLEH